MKNQKDVKKGNSGNKKEMLKLQKKTACTSHRSKRVKGDFFCDVCTWFWSSFLSAL